MRIDRLLCCLRFVKTRSQAQRWIDAGHIRCNGVRVIRHSLPIAVDDILVLPVGADIRVAKILVLPNRRGSPAVAQSQYRLLDQQGDNAIANR
ncbi:MAG: S4 domain-containing protein [Pontixanthobacter sp.]